MTLKKGQNLRKDKLDDILAEVGTRADVSSALIYVYSYTTKSKNRAVRKNTLNSTRFGSRFKVENHEVIKHGVGKVRSRGSRHGIGKKPVDEKHNECWAVLLEGRLNPIKRVFQTKDEALKYAMKLKRLGKGKKVVVVN